MTRYTLHVGGATVASWHNCDDTAAIASALCVLAQLGQVRGELHASFDGADEVVVEVAR